MRELKRINVEDIERDTEQPRKLFDEQELVSLGQNMRAHGQQVPVIVYSPEAGNGDGKEKRYRLLDGERRWRGAQLAGIGELDAIILAQRPTETALHLLQMSLEAHKQGLTAMERSNLLQRIRAENNWQITELASQLHMKQSVVSKLLAYQKLDPSIQAMLHRGEIDTERAFIISQEADPAKQLELVKGAGGLTRQQLRQRTKGGGSTEVKTCNARFRQLDKLGWIKEVNQADRYKLLASDYVAIVAERKSCLVVSPTHMEGNWITDQIRGELRRAGKLGAEQRTFRVLENANLTAAERSDAVNYLPGDVLVFHQNGKGFTKGQRLVVGESPLPLREAAKFLAYHADVLPLAPGDIIRINRNGQTADGKHRLNNGATFTVTKFSREGDIVLSNGWTVSKDFGHFSYGYVVTSHASQGKTVDRVLIGQSSRSFPASSREQFYVSVSRGRQRATVYTDDKNALLEAVRHSDDRLTATEFLSGRERGLAMQRMERDATKDVSREERVREAMTYER